MNESNKDEKYFAIIAVAVFSFHSTVAVFLALTQSDSISLGFNFTLGVSPVLRMNESVPFYQQSFQSHHSLPRGHILHRRCDPFHICNSGNCSRSPARQGETLTLEKTDFRLGLQLCAVD